MSENLLGVFFNKKEVAISDADKSKLKYTLKFIDDHHTAHTVPTAGCKLILTIIFIRPPNPDLFEEAEMEFFYDVELPETHCANFPTTLEPGHEVEQLRFELMQLKKQTTQQIEDLKLKNRAMRQDFAFLSTTFILFFRNANLSQHQIDELLQLQSQVPETMLTRGFFSMLQDSSCRTTPSSKHHPKTQRLSIVSPSRMQFHAPHGDAHLDGPVLIHNRRNSAYAPVVSIGQLSTSEPSWWAFEIRALSSEHTSSMSLLLGITSKSHPLAKFYKDPACFGWVNNSQILQAGTLKSQDHAWTLFQQGNKVIFRLDPLKQVLTVKVQMALDHPHAKLHLDLPTSGPWHILVGLCNANDQVVLVKPTVQEMESF